MDAYRAAVLADRPVLLWPLWEGGGTVARDLSGNGRNGTYNGSPVLRGGSAMPGTPGVLFGSTRYVQSTANLVLGSSFAYEVWVNKIGHLGGQPGDINSVIGDLASTSNGALLRYDGATTPRFYYAASGAYRTVTITGNAHVLNLRYHIVISVKVGGRVRIILNGKVVNDEATIGTPAGINTPFRVARSEDGRYISAALSWAAAYNTEITPDSARRHYDAGLRDLRRRGLTA